MPRKPHRLHGHNPPIDLDRDTAPDNQIPALKSRARAAKPAAPEHYAPPATSRHRIYHNLQVPAPTHHAWYQSPQRHAEIVPEPADRKSTRLNSSHVAIPYAVFCTQKTP